VLGAITVPFAVIAQPNTEELLKRELIERMSDYPCAIDEHFIYDAGCKTFTISSEGPIIQATEWTWVELPPQIVDFP